MNIARLNYLADELERQNPSLYLGAWRTCASGFATRLPAFKEQGLGVYADGWGHNSIPTYAGYVHGTALMRFFGLSQRQTIYLFAMAPKYAKNTTGIAHARRIRGVVRRHQAVTAVKAWFQRRRAIGVPAVPETV